MRSTILVALVAAIFCGCSKPNKKYTDMISQYLKAEFNGLELDYQNIDFKWVDTLLIHEQITELKAEYADTLSTVLNLEYYTMVPGFPEGKAFSKEYLTKERFEQLRNWELVEAHPNKYSWGTKASWVEDGYSDYYDFACANSSKTDWLLEICNRIKVTDSLLSLYDELEEGNIQLLQVTLEFYKRIEQFYGVTNPFPFAELRIVENTLIYLKQLNDSITALETQNPNQVVHYLATNLFKIKNPYLSNTPQEIRRTFVFDPNLFITDSY